MDAHSIVQSVHSTTVTVKNWLDGTDKSDKHIADLSAAVNLVYNALGTIAPLPVLPLIPTPLPIIAKRLDSKVLASLLGIGEALSRIKDHLSVWKDTRMTTKHEVGSIDRANLRDWLRKDERLLMYLVSTVLQSLKTVPKIKHSISGVSFQDTVENEDVREFWKKQIGEDVLYAKNSSFEDTLQRWNRGKLATTTVTALVLRLDEFAIGGVTPSSLDRFVGEKTLKEAITDIEERNRIPLQPWRSSKRRSTIQPWLIWIDDIPSNNIKEVSHAEKTLGVKVFSFPSTASAKVWIDAHESRIRQQDDAGCLGFISDNTRWELESRWQQGTGVGSSFLDLSAGETILRYLRGKQYMAPVLIYCDLSLPSTKYVRAYKRAGSTKASSVVRGFIQALGKGTDADKCWAKYNVVDEV